MVLRPDLIRSKSNTDRCECRARTRWSCIGVLHRGLTLRVRHRGKKLGCEIGASVSDPRRQRRPGKNASDTHSHTTDTISPIGLLSVEIFGENSGRRGGKALPIWMARFRLEVGKRGRMSRRGHPQRVGCGFRHPTAVSRPTPPPNDRFRDLPGFTPGGGAAFLPAEWAGKPDTAPTSRYVSSRERFRLRDVAHTECGLPTRRG
jgi:hypothetical protein